MKKAFLALAAIGAVASITAAAPAGAAVPIASVYEAGRCIVREDRSAGIALMRSLPLDSRPADLSSLRGSRAAGCLSSAGVSSLLIRGAIAQELFLRDFRAFGREPRDHDQLINLNLPVETAGDAPGATQLYRWSDCVVRNDTTNTERLLRSAVGSAEESAALSGLQTYMSACFASDSQLNVRASEVRSLFAQSAYFAMYRYWTGQLRSARNDN